MQMLLSGLWCCCGKPWRAAQSRQRFRCASARTRRTALLGRLRAQVMIAACDTFRSGAVEQLKTHCARLGVPLYERGYEKDPAKVAFEAQRAAARASTDVLLVDTAGAAHVTFERARVHPQRRGQGCTLTLAAVRVY